MQAQRPAAERRPAAQGRGLPPPPQDSASTSSPMPPVPEGRAPPSPTGTTSTKGLRSKGPESEAAAAAEPAGGEGELSPGLEHLEMWEASDVEVWIGKWDHTYHRVLAFWTPEMTARLVAEGADGMMLAEMTVDEMAERFGLITEQAHLFHSALGRVDRLFPAETEFVGLDSIELDEGEDLTQTHSDPTIIMHARLDRIKQLGAMVEEPASGAKEALERFDAESARDNIVVGQIDVSDVLAIHEAAKQQMAELDAKTRDLQQRRAKALVDKEDAARDRLALEQQDINAKLRRVEMQLVHVEREILRKLRRQFRQGEERMRVHLENNQAIVQQADGKVSLSGQAFGHTNRHYSIEWANAPQPMAVHLRCMRAVKEKLPMGRYVLVCTLYDSLGGAGLRWSNLDVREGWNDVTSPFQHGGMWDEVELTIDQTIRVVVPCAAQLVPSMALMFELVKLDDSGGGEVVGWGVFPACNAANDHISGKLKVPLLAGPIDHSLDKHSKIERCISQDLNRWLCNLYFEVELLQKMSEETR
eukprot:SAG22_NODE_2094_length_3020_cov_2.981171_2_plen_531_part_00